MKKLCRAKKLRKKRGKKIDANEGGVDGPPPKKSKAASRRGKTVNTESVCADELPPKPVTTSKKAKKVVAGDAEGITEAEGLKPKKSRAKGTKAEAKKKAELVGINEEIGDIDTAEDGGTPCGSDAFEDEPKTKKGRKLTNNAGDGTK